MAGKCRLKGLGQRQGGRGPQKARIPGGGREEPREHHGRCGAGEITLVPVAGG